MTRHLFCALLLCAFCFATKTANAQVVPIGPCCQDVPIEDILQDVEQRAKATRGVMWFQETERHYRYRYMRALTGELTKQSWSVLTALEALSDQDLCGMSCAEADIDLRHVVESAISWKNLQEANRWSEKLYLVAFISVVVGIITAIAAVLTVDWFRVTHTRREVREVLRDEHAHLDEVVNIHDAPDDDWRTDMRHRLRENLVRHRRRRAA